MNKPKRPEITEPIAPKKFSPKSAKTGVALPFVFRENGFEPCCSTLCEQLYVQMRQSMVLSFETALLRLFISRPRKTLLENIGYWDRL